MILFAGEVVGGLYDAVNAVVKVTPASVVGAEDGKGEARAEFETKVDLAVLSGLFYGFTGTNAGGELLIEICCDAESEV